MGEYFREILAVLREKFPGYLIVTEETAGGYTAPCLLVQKKETRLKRELEKRYRREDRFSVTLFTGEKDLALTEEQGNILAEALGLLPSGQRAEEVKVSFASDQAKAEVTYGGILFKTEEPGVIINSGKLSLHLEGGDYGRGNILGSE